MAKDKTSKQGNSSQSPAEVHQRTYGHVQQVASALFKNDSFKHGSKIPDRVAGKSSKKK
jgi:hypothetical protein